MPMRSRGLVVVIASLAIGALAGVGSVLVSPSPAAYASCSPAPIHVVAPSGSDVPINTHVRIATQFAVPSSVAVRAVSGKAPVVSKQVVVGPVGGQVIDLTPSLVAHTNYEVVVDKTNVIGTFSTGTRVDANPPSWGGTANGTFGISICGCPCTNLPYARLRIATPSDDATSPAAVTFGAWTANAAGAIDYTRAPDFYLDADADGRLLVGRPIDCTPATLDFGTATTKLGFRAIDLAGHMSAVDEVVLPVPPPRDELAKGDVAFSLKEPAEVLAKAKAVAKDAPKPIDPPLVDSHDVKKNCGAGCSIGLVPLALMLLRRRRATRRA